MEAIGTISPPVQLIRSVNTTIPLADIMRPTISGGVVALPVDGPISAARFKHDEGVPAPVEGTGYPISKLQAIDALIDRLIKMNKDSMLSDIPKSTIGFSESQLDALVTELGKRVSNAMQSGLPRLSSEIGLSLGTESSHKGIFLDTVA